MKLKLELEPENELFQKDIKNDSEQLSAITRILLGVSKPFPYVIFGPPGTGKTATIVEAIKQIIKRSGIDFIKKNLCNFWR